MKVLKIKEGKAYFVKMNDEGTEDEIITNITADDINNIIKYIVNGNRVEHCELENIKINNEAERIIYEELSKKINELIHNLDEINREIHEEYMDVFNKYKIEL